MALTLILALQAAATAHPAAAPPTGGPGWAMADPSALRGLGDALAFDLARYRGGDGACAGAAAGDVLVCGRLRHGGGDYPLAYWARVFGPEPPIRAEMGLGGGATGDVHVEQQEYSNGTVAKRVMVGIRLPF